MLQSIAPLYPAHPLALYHSKNCDILLSANSVNLKDLTYRCDYLYIYIYIYIYIYNFKQPAAFHFRRHHLDSLTLVVQLNTQQQKRLCIYCKYNSVSGSYSLNSICTESVLWGKKLNITCTVSLCEQQSAAKYIHCAKVCVFGKESYRNVSFSSFIPFCPSVFR
jgi:hypothetical protein